MISHVNKGINHYIAAESGHKAHGNGKITQDIQKGQHIKNSYFPEVTSNSDADMQSLSLVTFSKINIKQNYCV